MFDQFFWVIALNGLVYISTLLHWLDEWSIDKARLPTTFLPRIIHVYIYICAASPIFVLVIAPNNDDCLTSRHESSDGDRGPIWLWIVDPKEVRHAWWNPIFHHFLALDFIQTQRIQYSHSSMLYDKSIAIHSNPSVLWVLRAGKQTSLQCSQNAL